MITEEEITSQWPPLPFPTNPILLCRLPLAADRRYDGSVLFELGESLVNLLAVKSGKGSHFSGRHRLACAAHGLENLYCCFHTDYSSAIDCLRKALPSFSSSRVALRARAAAALLISLKFIVSKLLSQI